VNADTEDKVEIFINDDDGYQNWLRTHPRGFVINMARSLNPLGYSALHRATCDSIREYTQMAQDGGFTGRQYAKVCADSVRALRKWMRERGTPAGRFRVECSHCEPE
jgi:hypothetical protein